jgi:hypothetical protein
MEKLEVLSPAGLPAVRAGHAVPRVAGLDGKTIGEIWNGVFKGDLTFPRIRELLKQRYPGLTIVPYTEFPHAPGSDHPAEQRERAQRIAALAREKGCDAVISGNGA